MTAEDHGPPGPQHPPIAVVGAFDTKGEDLSFMQKAVSEYGYSTITIDTSVIGAHNFPVDITANKVADAGGETVDSLRSRGDRGHAMEVMQKGLTAVVRRLFDERKVSAVLGAGGGAGTSVITAAMRALPFGVPKVMITTLASGETGMYLQEKDIVLLPSIVDIAGVNRISAGVYTRAAGAIAGMADAAVNSTGGKDTELKPVAAATMFGNTTPAVETCKEKIESGGWFEVIIFHANGTGGKTMESLIRERRFSGVIDITTTELADELAGGVMSAGGERLTAAGETGIPQVIVPGCVDMVNFWGIDMIPEKYRSRLFYRWNPDVTLMRTNPEENREIGRMIAERTNRASGPAALLLPLQGVSLLDSPGHEFWWPEADGELFTAIRKGLATGIPCIELDININDPVFAAAAAEKFIELTGIQGG